MSAYIEVTVPDMMQAREARYFMQRTMLKRYPGAALVCLTMNIAGPVKTTPAIERAFDWGMDSVRAVLAGNKLLFEADIHEKTGPEAVFVAEGDAKEIKRRLCLLEDNCEIGRLLDIDVIDASGGKISRTDIGLRARKCLLCEQVASVCARSRAHTVDELFAYTHQIIDEHFALAFAKRTAQMAQRALLYEVAITPKPGLVDRINAGAHSDMDIFTFVDSACALRDYFETCTRIGLEHHGRGAKTCFDALRTPGLLAEREMKEATGSVNTHKGAIFSLGIYCAALGMGYDGSGSDTITALNRCRKMTHARMEEELARIDSAEATTFGETIYKKSRIGGVRAEAASGFSSVRDAALPRLKAALDAGVSLNDAGLCALVTLMARTQDTNAVRRGGEEAAGALRCTAETLEEEITAHIAGGTLVIHMEEIRECLIRWDAELSAAHISPGGCADLLALTLLVKFMEE